tara:strand:- start:534 stop:761 length:228 start_codon:yes stop_codon:yes gene_type:complete
MIIDFLFDLFIIIVIFYIVYLFYSYKDLIFKKMETFKNLNPKHLDNQDEDIYKDIDVRKYTRFLNPLNTTLFQKN